MRLVKNQEKQKKNVMNFADSVIQTQSLWHSRPIALFVHHVTKWVNQSFGKWVQICM